MVIVDAQCHVWGADTPQRPWPVPPPGLQAVKPHKDVPVTKESLLGEMDAAGVDRVILVPPSWEGDRNDLALEAARAHPQRFAVMGRLDIDAPDARDQVRAWRSQPGMLGLRFTFQTPLLEKPLLEGRVDWVWKEAEKAGVPVKIMAPQRLAPLIDQVAERHPSLKIVMDHLSLLIVHKDEAAFADLDKLLVLAKRPNVAVKASALPCYTTDTYPYRRLHPYLRRVYDAFGPKRIFWGTDLSRLPCTYREGIDMFAKEIPWFSADDKAWIMGRGICEWLGWPLSAKT